MVNSNYYLNKTGEKKNQEVPLMVRGTHAGPGKTGEWRCPLEKRGPNYLLLCLSSEGVLVRDTCVGKRLCR